MSGSISNAAGMEHAPHTHFPDGIILFLHNKAAAAGVIIITALVIGCALGPSLIPYGPLFIAIR